MDLTGKLVVITGGGQGLGRSMAISLASKGARLAVIDLSQENLDETVGLCAESGGEARGYLANVTQEEEVAGVFDQIVLDMGSIDGLVNNAGITRDALLIKKDKEGNIQKSMSLGQWQSVLDVNLTGVFLCGREAAAKMAEAGTKGLIVNICSVCKAGNAGQSNYSAAKAGVEALTVTWSKELSRFGIRVAGIAPGFIATEMTEMIKPETRDKIVSMIPMQRMGSPDEIAHSAIYLFENDYFTGRVLEMDGGIRM